MEFEYVEYEYLGDAAAAGPRISALLSDGGYQSLRRETAELVRRYLPTAAQPAADRPPAAACTTDALIPPGDSAARILLCERPTTGTPGVVVALLALGRSQIDANRACTAARLLLDNETAPGDGAARSRRFRQEWLPAFGFGRPPAAPSAAAKPLAAAQALLALQQAPTLLGRPSILRSQADRSGDLPRGAVDLDVVDRLVPEKLVDRTFVLVCRDTGQIVGVREAADLESAMPPTLRCPHCRRPLADEAQDVVYSLSAQGEEFLRSARWVRDAVDAALQRRHCDTVAAPEGTAGSPVDLAALCYDTVLLVRTRDRAPCEEDVHALADSAAAFAAAVPGVPVRGVFATSFAASSNGDVPAGGCTVLELSHLDAGLDRLVEDVKQEAFVRLAGSAMEMVRPEPRSLFPSSRP